MSAADATSGSYAYGSRPTGDVSVTSGVPDMRNLTHVEGASTSTTAVSASPQCTPPLAPAPAHTRDTASSSAEPQPTHIEEFVIVESPIVLPPATNGLPGGKRMLKSVGAWAAKVAPVLAVAVWQGIEAHKANNIALDSPKASELEDEGT
ncbi:hypothetical protein AnigIFM56816_000162 [Aspergillus niger]|nr:hypothetical protein AnigIFM56816_000162 [Aspergillus niger]